MSLCFHPPLRLALLLALTLLLLGGRATRGQSALPLPADALTLNQGGPSDDDIVSEGAPALRLSAFDAVQQPTGESQVRWTSTDERQTLGYHLWRGDSPLSPDERLTRTLIPALAGGSPNGASYDWTDSAAGGARYYYWLDDVDQQQVVTRHGPVLAQPQSPSAVTLGTVSGAPATRGRLAALALAAGALLLVARRARRTP